MRTSKLFALIALALSFSLSSAAQPEEFRPNDRNRQAIQITHRLPFASRSQLLGVEIVGGRIVLEGDIILGDESMLTGPTPVSAGTSDRRWPNGVIPFVLNTTHSRYSSILKALDTVNRETTLSFVPRTDERDYVEFEDDDGCASYVGRKGSRQPITIGSCSFGSIIHEILHAAGLFHEQSRSDRDDFITINWKNIVKGKEDNFKTYTELKRNGSDLGDYDYGSIMHYGPTAFSISESDDKPTITPTDSSVRIGQRDAISAGDLAGIKSMYPTKTIRYEPMVVIDKIDSSVIVKPSEPMVQTRKRGGIFIKP